MEIKGLLVGIATVAGVLCTFGALMLFAMSKLNDTQGGRGEGAMIGCALAAAACYGAAVFINGQNLNVFGN